MSNLGFALFHAKKRGYTIYLDNAGVPTPHMPPLGSFLFACHPDGRLESGINAQAIPEASGFELTHIGSWR